MSPHFSKDAFYRAPFLKCGISGSQFFQIVLVNNLVIGTVKTFGKLLSELQQLLEAEPLKFTQSVLVLLSDVGAVVHIRVIQLLQLLILFADPCIDLPICRLLIQHSSEFQQIANIISCIFALAITKRTCVPVAVLGRLLCLHVKNLLEQVSQAERRIVQQTGCDLQIKNMLWKTTQ